MTKFLTSALLFITLALGCIKPTHTDPNAVTAPATQPQGTEGITEIVSVIDTMGQVVLAEKPLDALSTAINPEPKMIVDPVAPVLSPNKPTTAQEERVVRILTTDVWVVWSLIRIKKPEETRINQGTWFRFKRDGTYEYGNWDKAISTGTWYFDPIQGFLNLDSKLKGDDRQWKLQMASSEDVMVWVGTPKFTTTDISLKLERFANVPLTRAELGVTQ